MLGMGLTTDLLQETSHKLFYFNALTHQFHAFCIGFCVGLQQHTKFIIVITVQVRNIAANSYAQMTHVDYIVENTMVMSLFKKNMRL